MNYVIELDEATYQYFKGMALADDGLPMFSNAYADEGYKLRVAMKRAEAEVAWEKYNEMMPPDTQFREYNSKEEFFVNEYFITPHEVV